MDTDELFVLLDELRERWGNDTRASVMHGVWVAELARSDRLAALLREAAPPLELVVTSDLDLDESVLESDAVLGVPVGVSRGGEPVCLGTYEDLFRPPSSVDALAAVALPPAFEPRPTWDAVTPGVYLVAAGPLPRARLVFGCLRPHGATVPAEAGLVSVRGSADDQTPDEDVVIGFVAASAGGEVGGAKRVETTEADVARWTQALDAHGLGAPRFHLVLRYD